MDWGHNKIGAQLGVAGQVTQTIYANMLMGVSLNYRQSTDYPDTCSWSGKVGAYNLKLDADTDATTLVLELLRMLSLTASLKRISKPHKLGDKT